ncbi:MAG TPA: ANTAR domain-containing protein [Acidimicrobiales bacterium]|nr:ANTAR domain-containing protein [Acidimicrobiales bacterium]
MASADTESWEELRGRLEAVQAQLQRNARRLVGTRELIRVKEETALDTRQLLSSSLLARMRARLESMPVIEQAKGILMVRSGCSAEEAFEVLRKASQRSNTPVRVLAQQIVDEASSRHRRRAANGFSRRPPPAR